jgi:Cadherin-like domain/RTX calcium-binding nonapeptide repeat (4 copies)
MLSFLFSTTSLNYLYSTSNYVGSFRHDVVFSSFLNDTISTGDGNDWVDSGAGNDVIDLGNGDDVAFAGNGDDSVDGGAGNDWIDGGRGNDVLRSGGGDDCVFGGQGNDTIIYRANAGAGLDRVNGGSGFDTLTLELTAAQQASAGFLADQVAFNAYLASGSIGNFTFGSIGLIVTGGFESLNIVTVTDPGGPTNTAPVVSGPVALSGAVEDTTYNFAAAALLANATDAEGNALSVENLQASSGTLLNNGNGNYIYTPAANANGSVNFTYSVSDGLLSTAASATLAIAAVNDGPVAGAAIVLPAVLEDNSTTITAAQLLVNASDVDSATLSVVNLQASSGTLFDNGGGNWTFTPAANDDTAVSFTYQISDGDASVAGSASLELTAVNDGPIAGAAIVLPAVLEDNSTTITAAQLLANASDIDSATLSVVNLLASSGTLNDNGGGNWTFTPDLNDDTAVTFTYQFSDGDASVAASATLDITPVNDAPVFLANSYLDMAVSSSYFALGYVYAYDVDTPLENLTFTYVLDEANPTLGFFGVGVNSEVAGRAEISYLPDFVIEATNFPILDQAQVMVSDGQGGESSTTINFTVLSDMETLFFTDANSNRGTLVGTLLVQDQFNFYNSVSEGVSSGVDYLDLFYSAIDNDTIRLSGDSFAADEIIASQTIDAANGSYTYVISQTGATLVSTVALEATDFSYNLILS